MPDKFLHPQTQQMRDYPWLSCLYSQTNFISFAFTLDIQNYQLKWNQHVLRMPENRLPRKALQYRPQVKRDLGRRYRRWKDQFM